MNNNKLIILIDQALTQADDFVIKYYDADEKPMLGTKKVLFLMRKEIESGTLIINRRVLRAMRDIGAMSVKTYENTPLDDAIGKLYSYLYNQIPEFKHLQPLGMDFGKGNPI